MTEKVDMMTVTLLRANPDKVYLFGDNDQRWGKKGQSVIRDEPNAIGVRTKKKPKYSSDAYYTDNEYFDNIKKIDEDIDRAVATGKTIVIPSAGIGTGLAKLDVVAVMTFKHLEERLKSI